MTLKTCKRCGEDKPLTEFYRNGKHYRTYCKECHVSYAKHHYIENKPAYKVSNRKYRFTKFGITEDDFIRMLDSQNYECAICGDGLSEEGKHTHIDHNHLTGEVRGILCSTCNQGIGLMKDSPSLLNRAAEYLSTNGHYG